MILIIILVAFVASLLTFFSGFGLGTILLPVFVLFFPVDLAIAMTAIVHFLNNIFKTGLVGQFGDRNTVLVFGIPALLFAILGSRLLIYLANFPIHVQYKLAGASLATSPVQVVIGVLLLIFGVAEIVPTRQSKPTSQWVLGFGGALSGFFGGLSGHQGALRAMFLIRLGLSKESFIATGIIISLMVDLSRLGVYWTNFPISEIIASKWYLIAAVVAAFSGALLGRRVLKKLTIQAIQWIVAIGIGAVGILLGLGVI